MTIKKDALLRQIIPRKGKEPRTLCDRSAPDEKLPSNARLR